MFLFFRYEAESSSSVIERLVAILEEGGADVEGVEITGWGVIRHAGDPLAIWGRLEQGKRLGLGGIQGKVFETERGERWSAKRDLGDGAKLLLSIERVLPEDLSYLVVKCELPGDAARGKEWEMRIRGFLGGFSGEKSLYFTAKGEFRRRLRPEEQLAWGKALCGYLQGKALQTVRTERYLNILSYTPFLPHSDVSRSFGYNLNIALVETCSGDKTQIYLGSPLITSEY